jgi:G3E family GTPase
MIDPDPKTGRHPKTGRWSLDARIPVVFAALSDLGPGDALLTDGPATADHPAGCLCCVARAPAADALVRLFLARARADVAFFRRVVAVVGNPEAVHAALRTDAMVTGRFRLD